MFARTTFRCAAPLRQNIRRQYATNQSETPNQSSSIALPFLIGAGVLVAGYAGYSFLGGTAAQRVTAPVKGLQKDIEKQAGSGGTGAVLKSQDPPKTFKGGDQDFIDLKLAEVKGYNHNTKKFIFELPEKDHVSGLNIASALVTRFKPEGEEKPVIRPYTPISDESEKGHLDLMVKAYPNGPMSQHLHSLKPGDTLSFKGPIPKYQWSPNKHSHITLIAGGTGITPMYQLTRAIFNNPEDETKVSLVFGNINEKDILLKEEFDELAKDYPQRFRAFYTLDDPPEEWKEGKGFITKELLKEVIPDPKSENIKVFVCGPPGLYKAISGTKPNPKDQGELTGILKELGYSKDQVFKF